MWHQKKAPFWHHCVGVPNMFKNELKIGRSLIWFGINHSAILTRWFYDLPPNLLINLPGHHSTLSPHVRQQQHSLRYTHFLGEVELFWWREQKCNYCGDQRGRKCTRESWKFLGQREDGMGAEKLRSYPGENNRLTWEERPDGTTNKFGHQFPLQRIHEKTCKIQIFPSHANKNVIPF